MYLTPQGPLRPDLVSIYRRVQGDTLGPTGNPVTTPEQLYDSIPAFVDHATRGVSDRLIFVPQTGESVEQTDTCYVDGLLLASYVGVGPGETIELNGIEYLVDYDGRGAFPDIQPFDVATRGSDNYLVLQATRYTDVFPVMILHLNFGRAWPLTSP